ncbi:hypothetical protein ACFPRL_36390 [Pseudoclavibacter helvolus]
MKPVTAVGPARWRSSPGTTEPRCSISRCSRTGPGCREKTPPSQPLLGYGS